MYVSNKFFECRVMKRIKGGALVTGKLRQSTRFARDKLARQPDTVCSR